MHHQKITAIDRVYFALWLQQHAKEYFLPLGGHHFQVRNWLSKTVNPFLVSLLGNGRIEEDALDSVLTETMAAASSEYFHADVDRRNPVLTALGEHNNIGKHVLAGNIGTEDVPKSVWRDAVMATKEELRNQGRSDVSLDDYATFGIMPWSESEDGYVVDPTHRPHPIVQALMNKTLSDADVAGIVESMQPPSLEEQVEANRRDIDTILQWIEERN